jgi:serine/threonine protein kinase
LSNEQSYAKSIKGTPLYAAPEIHRNEPHQKSVDIWSFGVMLYELCTLNLPFSTIEKILKPIPNYCPFNEEEEEEYC